MRAPMPVVDGQAMLVPVSEVVAQSAVDDDTIPTPGLYTSGFRRPSDVGPVPPEPWFAWFGCCWVAPTARQFLAFSGVFRVERLVTANATRSSSNCRLKRSMSRQKPV